MKNAFKNTAFLDELRERLTKKNVTSLLILSAIIAALFATPTGAFANSNVIIGDGPLHPTSVTPTPSNGSPNPTADRLSSTHMLDKTHGWGLTYHAVLKTVDGGLHWQKVTPANVFGNNTMIWSTLQGAFNGQDVWVVAGVDTAPNGKSTPMNTLMIIRSTNGGQTWQNSTINTPAGTDPDKPEFLNASVGWLQSYQVTSTGTFAAIFHTTDGGLHWNQLTTPNSISLPAGIFFKDVQNGWEAGTSKAGAQPSLGVTHDGGKTWQSQPLPALPGAGKSDALSTKPPVLFGNNGLLPVEDTIAPPPGSKSNSIGLDLYVTHNGGQTWAPTKLITSNLPSNQPPTTTFYAEDSQHIWAALGTNLYATSNGGQSWTQLPPSQQQILEFDFIDPNNGWATTPTSLLHTTNGGHTWQTINYVIAGQPTASGTPTTSGTPTKPTLKPL